MADVPSCMDRAAFIERFGGIFEHSAWVAEATFDAGLGAAEDTAPGLHAAMVRAMRAAPRDRQFALIRAHPDLAGRLALQGELTADSTAEQASAGLDQCTPEELQRFQELNEAYTTRFGMPFVMAVKGRSRAEILAAFERRLDNDPDAEIVTALAEIETIARFRLEALLPPGQEQAGPVVGADDPIAAFLRQHAAEQIAVLAHLVRTPSDNPPGDLAAAAEVGATCLEGLGFTVERHPVPDPVVREAGMVSATNLVVRQRFGPGPVVALNAHGDVVPPGDGWRHAPYGAVVEDGWMYGRGAAVSKSDIATYAYALLALGNCPPRRGTIELHITYDEEVGGVIGPKWLLDQGITKPDYAIAAGFSYGVVTAHNGCLHLEVELRGRSAHAALPATGVDALEAASGVLGALYAHRAGLSAIRSATPGISSPTLVVGLIEGGINTNVVPDRVVFRLDRRLIPEEDAGAVERELRALIERAAGRYPGIGLGLRRVLLARPLAPVGDALALADRLAHHASRVLGEPVTTLGVPLYTDARHYAAAGVATVLYGAGPRTIEDANAHRADERVPVALLPKASAVIASALGDLLAT